ncbi:hypothetical protein ACFX2C_034955 [Malus domestica]
MSTPTTAFLPSPPSSPSTTSTASSPPTLSRDIAGRGRLS